MDPDYEEVEALEEGSTDVLRGVRTKGSEESSGWFRGSLERTTIEFEDQTIRVGS